MHAWGMQTVVLVLTQPTAVGPTTRLAVTGRTQVPCSVLKCQTALYGTLDFLHQAKRMVTHEIDSPAVTECPLRLKAESLKRFEAAQSG